MAAIFLPSQACADTGEMKGMKGVPVARQVQGDWV